MQKDILSIQNSFLAFNDLLSNKSINLFFQAKEAIHEYIIGFGVLRRREISISVYEVLEEFLNYHFSNQEIDFLNNILSGNAKVLKKINRSEIKLVKLLKSLDKEGYKLLKIKNNINISILKDLYREASKKYHPDLGGSKEKMQKINDAHTLFHETISNYVPLKETNEDVGYIISSSQNWNEWLFSIHLVLACIFGDLFAADKAFNHLVKSYEYFLKSNSDFIGQFIENFIEFSGLLYNTCHSLGRFNMEEKLKQATKITMKYIQRYIDEWIPRNEYDEKPKKENFPRKKDLLGSLGIRIVIKHQEQAKNAYRLGKIDKKRFMKLMKKYDVKDDKEKDINNKINEFIKNVGFVTELTRSNYKTKSINPKIIIAPNESQDRFILLEEEQKWEYLLTFSKSNKGDLFKKYYIVRTNEILMDLIENYERLNLNKIKKEIDFFNKNFPEIFDRYFLLKELLDYLSEMNKKVRRKKLKLLKDLDDPERKDTSSFSITIDFSIFVSSIRHPKDGYKKRIELNKDYIEFVKMDIEKIIKYKNTGEVQNQYTASWNRDMTLLHDLENTEMFLEKNRIWLNTKNPTPEMVINSLEPCLEELLRIRKKFHPKNTGELQIGYSINRITTAYGKLKNWDKVIFWGELFLNLPRNYRDRSSLSEQENIRKRIEKAKIYKKKQSNI